MQHAELQDRVCISKSVCQAPWNPAICSSLRERLQLSGCSQLTLASHQSPFQTGTCQFKGKVPLVRFPFALLLTWVMDKYNFSYCLTTFYLPHRKQRLNLSILVACTGKEENGGTMFLGVTKKNPISFTSLPPAEQRSSALTTSYHRQVETFSFSTTDEGFCFLSS